MSHPFKSRPEFVLWLTTSLVAGAGVVLVVRGNWVLGIGVALLALVFEFSLAAVDDQGHRRRSEAPHAL